MRGCDCLQHHSARSSSLPLVLCCGRRAISCCQHTRPLRHCNLLAFPWCTAGPGLEAIFSDLLKYEASDSQEAGGAEFYMKPCPANLEGTKAAAAALSAKAWVQP